MAAKACKAAFRACTNGSFKPRVNAAINTFCRVCDTVSLLEIRDDIGVLHWVLDFEQSFPDISLY